VIVRQNRTTVWPRIRPAHHERTHLVQHVFAQPENNSPPENWLATGATMTSSGTKLVGRVERGKPH
jgi:hypothetical protein